MHAYNKSLKMLTRVVDIVRVADKASMVVTLDATSVVLAGSLICSISCCPSP